jgi:hypothetical protein
LTGKISPEEQTLLGLAGAFNAEGDRWALRRQNGMWQVIRETEEVYPDNIEVKAEFKTNGEAHEALTTMSDIASAVAFLAVLNEVLAQE